MANITKSVVEDAALGWLEGMFASIEQAMFGESLYPSTRREVGFPRVEPWCGRHRDVAQAAGAASTLRHLFIPTDHQQFFSLPHLIAHVVQNALHDAGLRGGDRVFHFHGFHDHQRIARFHEVSFLDQHLGDGAWHGGGEATGIGGVFHALQGIMHRELMAGALGKDDHFMTFAYQGGAHAHPAQIGQQIAVGVQFATYRQRPARQIQQGMIGPVVGGNADRLVAVVKVQDMVIVIVQSPATGGMPG